MRPRGVHNESARRIRPAPRRTDTKTCGRRCCGGSPAARWRWVGRLVLLGVTYGHGSPVLWDPGDIGETLSNLLRRKVTIESAAEAERGGGRVPAFFRWASRVALVPHAAAIDAVLE